MLANEGSKTNIINQRAINFFLYETCFPSANIGPKYSKHYNLAHL